MNELKKYQNLQAKLNNLLQLSSTEIFFSSTSSKAVQKSSTRDYYGENITTIPRNKSNKDFKRENRMDLDKFVPFLNKTQLQEGISSYKMSLQTAGIVVIVVIILTCCCTLYLRNKLMALVHRLVGKKTKDRGLLPVDLEKGKGELKRGSTSLKKLQKIETKPTIEDVTHPAPQYVMTTTSSVQAKPSSTTCCKCFKKKKKKTRKKHKR